MVQKINKTPVKTNLKNKSPKNVLDMCDLVPKLLWWTEIFKTAFFKDQLVPPPTIFYQKINTIIIGHIGIGSNGFGELEFFKKVYLNRPLWDILAILLHEMTHSWQALYAKPSNSWYHNKEFRDKMLEFGIVCNKSGCHYGVSDPFVSLLEKHRIVFNHIKDPDGFISIPPVLKPKGSSKLKKWSCGCTNIRVAVKGFQAKCLRCGNEFDLAP